MSRWLSYNRIAVLRTILSASSNPVPLKLPPAHRGEGSQWSHPTFHSTVAEQPWAPWGSSGQERQARRAVPLPSVAHPLPPEYKNTFYSDKNIYSGKSVHASPGSLAGPWWAMADAMWAGDRAEQPRVGHSTSFKGILLAEASWRRWGQGGDREHTGMVPPLSSCVCKGSALASQSSVVLCPTPG